MYCEGQTQNVTFKKHYPPIPRSSYFVKVHNFFFTTQFKQIGGIKLG
jgi:hypothetical protein